jgi:hypothetical protein
MMTRIISILFFLTVGISAHCQDDGKELDIPDSFHIQMEAFEAGELVFKFNTRKEVFMVSSKGNTTDTSMTFTWNDNAKRAFVTFLHKKGVLTKMQKNAISKPSDINGIKLLTHLMIWDGDEKMEFWFKKKANNESSEAIKKVNSNMKDPIDKMIGLSLKVIKRQKAGKE